MIYLFCNEKFGKPFESTARKFFNNNQHDFIVIHSDIQPDTYQSLSNYLNQAYYWAIKQKGKSMYNIPLKQIKDINKTNFTNTITKQDHGIIAGFNQIFKKDTIARFKTLVNFHPSILPLYRGPVPSYWCIKNKENWTGYTLHKVNEKIDDGEILYQEKFSFRQTSEEVLDKEIANAAQKIFLKYLEFILGFRENFERKTLDPYKIYKSHVKYKSFPQ